MGILNFIDTVIQRGIDRMLYMYTSRYIYWLLPVNNVNMEQFIK